MTIRYSDGDAIEARILSIVRDEKALGSDRRIATEQWNDWPVRYHLSPDRANLVRHLDWTGLDVLELGAGMGAVSRYLAEHAQSLTVVEGTEQRFAVLRERLRDLNNWEGHVANLISVDLPKKFDVVCVIGVLEYSQLYIDAEDPYVAFLEKAKSFLKPGGVLLLAIENKLGLKYWSGAAEDHSSEMFDGICGYPVRKAPKTFARQELRDLLGRAGLGTIVEQFPCPDYKLPSSIITTDLVDADARLAGDLAASRQYVNYMLPRVNFFPDLLAMQTVSRAGLFKEFSNSFLFLATVDETSTTRQHLLRRQDAGELAWHYGGGDHASIETVFFRSDGLKVKKIIRGEQEIPKPLFWVDDGETEVFAGENLRFRLFRLAYFAEWDQFQAELEKFVAWSLKQWRTDEKMDERALDAIVNNVILTADDEYRVFDLEWRWRGGFSASFFIFRNVYSLTRERDLFTSRAPFGNFRALYERLCQGAGITPALEDDIALEIRIQSSINQHASLDDFLVTMRDLFQAPFRDSVLPRQPKREFEFRQPGPEFSLRQAAADLVILREEVDRLNGELARAGDRTNEIYREFLSLQTVLASAPHKLAGKFERLPYVSKMLNRSYSGLKKFFHPENCH